MALLLDGTSARRSSCRPPKRRPGAKRLPSLPMIFRSCLSDVCSSRERRSSRGALAKHGDTVANEPNAAAGPTSLRVTRCSFASKLGRNGHLLDAARLDRAVSEAQRAGAVVGGKPIKL